MKILLAITNLGVGGAERLVTGLADRFVKDGHEVLLVNFHGEPELRPGDSRVRLVNLYMRRSPLSILGAMQRFWRLVREFRPDVVNSHLFHANMIARLVRLVKSMPKLVCSAHNTNEGGRLRMLSYRLTDGLAEISTNVSDEAVEAFERQGALRPGRMVCILNGIDTQSFVYDVTARQKVRRELAIEDSTSLLLAVGRLSKQKDYPNLLRALAGLATSPVPARLAIVGSGPLRGELEAMADSLGIAERVNFLGMRHDVPALMSACDVFVLPSAWEGFGLVVAEAMACLRPVVATDCGGVREVVGNAGFLVPPNDSTALAVALERAQRLSPEERERLIRDARKRVVANFSIDAMADRYLEVYQGNRAEPQGVK